MAKNPCSKLQFAFSIIMEKHLILCKFLRYKFSFYMFIWKLYPNINFMNSIFPCHWTNSSFSVGMPNWTCISWYSSVYSKNWQTSYDTNSLRNEHLTEDERYSMPINYWRIWNASIQKLLIMCKRIRDAISDSEVFFCRGCLLICLSSLHLILY